MSTPAYKEWKLVADALMEGRQTVLMRKGGIHEGREGFAFSHDRFWIFPTWFHSQTDSLKGNVALPPPPFSDDKVEIEAWAEIVRREIVTDWAIIEKLNPYHIWKPELLRQRFEQDDEQCLHVAIVHVYRLSTPWILPMEKRYGGCRSWVELPTPEGLMASADPVFSMPETNMTTNPINAILDESLEKQP